MAKKAQKQPQPDVSSRAAEVSRKVAKRGAREGRRAFRRFVRLTLDMTRTVLGVGQRRVNRRNNRTTIGRYINDIITLAETAHLLGLRVNLSEVLVEPRFLPEPDVVEPVDTDDVLQEVFYVIPRQPDLLELVAPYNLPSFRIEELTAGNRRIAILGAPGSGKTTALMAIALWALREIAFPEKDDPVKRRIEEEIDQLTDRERKGRERKREEMLESARVELENAIERGEVANTELITSAAEAYEAEQMAGLEQLPPFETLTPIYIHMADLNVSAGAFGPEIDPAEPLMRALQRSVSTLTARTIPRMIYKRLETNQALILMDGYAELPPAEQARVRAWLGAFLAQYGKNFIIMTGPEQGYGALTQLDITPLFIKPWNQNEREEYVAKWADLWPEITATRKEEGKEISTSLRKRALNNSHGITPAELTLKLWSAFSSEEATYQLSEWIEFYLQSQLPASQDYAEILPLMSITGALQTDLGFMTRRGIEVLVQQQEATGSAGISGETLAQLDTDGDGVADEDTDPAEEDDDEAFDAEDEAALRRSRLVQTLVFAGMLQRFRGGRYRYRHSILSDYLASLTLTDLPE
ncbi:MAG: DEAD/DEAH box helicase family protein, partial [Chloroflexota bacterium]